ncbi:hypothetical protein LTR85_004059 [Meristemomyces frigidus]|nr:hypothetical protein LTR85_004059 [Meristemomyces frigidus]
MTSRKPSKTTEERNLRHLESLVEQRLYELDVRDKRYPWLRDSQSSRRKSCVFDGMTAAELKEAFTHFYTHPEELPEKEHSGEPPAWLRGKNIGGAVDDILSSVSSLTCDEAMPNPYYDRNYGYGMLPALSATRPRLTGDQLPPTFGAQYLARGPDRHGGLFSPYGSAEGNAAQLIAMNTWRQQINRNGPGGWGHGRTYEWGNPRRY